MATSGCPAPPAQSVGGTATGLVDSAVVINRGQPSLTTSPPACLTKGLNEPQGVILAAGKRSFADPDNDRVRIDTSIRAGNSQSADVVLGQLNRLTCSSNADKALNQPSNTTLLLPADMCSDGDALLIGNSDKVCVVVYASFPTKSQQAATPVLGHKDPNSHVAAPPRQPSKHPRRRHLQRHAGLCCRQRPQAADHLRALPGIIDAGYSGQSFEHALGQPHSSDANDHGVQQHCRACSLGQTGPG